MDLTRLVLYPLLGAALGYGYYRLIGCRSGTCPITRSPYTSTLYGAVVGLLSASSG